MIATVGPKRLVLSELFNILLILSNIPCRSIVIPIFWKNYCLILIYVFCVRVCAQLLMQTYNQLIISNNSVCCATNV